MNNEGRSELGVTSDTVNGVSTEESKIHNLDTSNPFLRLAMAAKEVDRDVFEMEFVKM